MTDLLTVLPSFSTSPFSNVLPSLERNQIAVADLITLDAVDVARRAQLPAREVRRLTDALLEALHDDLAIGSTISQPSVENRSSLVSTGTSLVDKWSAISLLDEHVDAALGGGIPTGYLTEIVGESGVGKTQLLLTLLLAVQLPPAQGGLSRSAIYISTEAPLQTSRLSQMLSSHPLLERLEEDAQKPSLANILSIQTPDLESQEHILRYQLPIAVRRHNVGLVVIDSITANYRAEFARDTRGPSTGNGGPGSGSLNGPAAMAKRTAQLLEVATLLRNLARTEDLAVVFANQVADRFDPPLRQPFQAQEGPRSTSAHASGSNEPSQDSPASSFASGGGDGATRSAVMDELMTLDHQQRFFTGWGDTRPTWNARLGIGSGPGYKTPSLGLVWANQIACRLALIKTTAAPAAAVPELASLSSDLDGNSASSHWQRHMKVVFAPWVKSSDGERGVELIIWKGGIKAAAAVESKTET